MMRKSLSVLLILVLVANFLCPAGFAADDKNLTRGAASLVIPGLGQYINGELETRRGRIKTGVMILIEAGAIITTAVVGSTAGYPQIWTGIGLFIFNHVWSSHDAYKNASAGPEVSLKEKSVVER